MSTAHLFHFLALAPLGVTEMLIILVVLGIMGLGLAGILFLILQLTKKK